MSLQGKGVDREAIIKEIAKRYKITEHQVAIAIRSQFRLVKRTMEEGEFKDVLLPYFGVFGVKGDRVKYLNETPEERAKRKQAKASSAGG